MVTIYTIKLISLYAVGCGQLDAPANGRVVTPSGTAPGSVAQYECNIGYKIEGLSTRLCLSTGIWVPEAPYCRSRHHTHAVSHVCFSYCSVHKDTLTIYLP